MLGKAAQVVWGDGGSQGVGWNHSEPQAAALIDGPGKDDFPADGLGHIGVFAPGQVPLLSVVT
jgi:hypothetical protein